MARLYEADRKADEADRHVHHRIRTGNVAADEVLHGGFPSNAIHIVMGQPGTGKTIFVEQVLFSNLDPERPALFLTTLSEPLSKVIRFVQGFDFYEADALGSAVRYEDVGRDLVEHGIGRLVTRLRESIKELTPSIIVIDSFRALHDLAASTSEFREMVHELTGLLSAYDTTTFLVGEYDRSQIPKRPEFAVADGVVELSRETAGARDERSFRVLKLRGSPYREGAHAFQITRAGIRVHPRLVTTRLPRPYDLPGGRASTGVPELDRMLEGGLVAGTTTLLTGASGSGKTTLGLQFLLEGVRRGEKCLCVNFQENPTQLTWTVERLAGDRRLAEALEVIYSSPVELQIDSIIGQLFDRIEDAGVERLMVDSVGDLAMAAGSIERLHDYLYALIQHLAVRGISSLLTFESPYGASSFHAITGPVSYMADNLITLGMGGEEVTRRTIRILKTRGSGHDPRVREIRIEPRGITLP